MLTSAPRRWREDHPKCKFCQYIELVIPKADHTPSYWHCKIKDKIVNKELPRYFCECYEVDREKIDF